MASTLEAVDHFKNPRQSRLPNLDNVSSLTFGSTFGVGKSMWNSTSDIWRSTNNFIDGAAAAAEPQAQGPNGTPTPIKTGSKSLLLSSESEAPSFRKNVPWATSVNTNPFVSHSQNQPISPLHQRQGNSHGELQHIGQNATLAASTLSSVQADFQSFPLGPSLTSHGPRSPLDMNSMVDHLPALDDQSASSSNLTAFRGSGPSNQMLMSRNFQSSPSDFRDGHSQQHVAGVKNLSYEASNTSSFRPSSVGDGSEPFPAGSKARPYDYSTKGHFGNGASNMRLSHVPKKDHQSNLRPPYQRHSTSTEAYNMTDDCNSAPSSARSESFHNYGNQRFLSYSRTELSRDPRDASPIAGEYKSNLNSPYYSNYGDAPPSSESLRIPPNSGISSRTSYEYGLSIDRGYQESGSFREYHNLQQNPFQAHIAYPYTHEVSGYPGAMRMNPLANPYTMLGSLNISGLPSAPRIQSRDSEHAQVVRSPLLEEFRVNNKNNKRYELRDIYNHVVEFSGDQHGSRFIQQKLETANSDEKDQIFTEIQPNLLQLMTDVFGNYVIQKLFEHGNQSQKKMLANQMKGHVLSLSTQMYGCRVVQKALEHILTDQQASLVKELENHVLKCVKDQNGNHVIQKAIERVPAEHIQFIIGAFADQVQRLATHPYGCRVIQRMLEHCQESARKSILKELHSCVPRLITDQFGNYVVQHIIENGEPEDKHSIVVTVLSQLLVFSKHKFASNVVEKSIEFAQEDQRSEILRRLTGQDEHGESPVLGLMRDQYGNYVIQKILGQLTGQEREALVHQIKSQLVQLKRFSYGKQIIAIERLIFDDQPNHSLSTSSQSSTLPSTNASTVEGPVTPTYHHDTNKHHETAVALPLAMGSNRA